MRSFFDSKREQYYLANSDNGILDQHRNLGDIIHTIWGRTGFDRMDASGIACRGRSVGLVNHRIKKP